MTGFGKYYESAFEGSMVGSGLAVFAVWGYVIAKTKPPGEIELNPKFLSPVLGGPVEEIRKAIEFLCSPDPDSRGQEAQGRRLVHVEGFRYSVPRWLYYRSLRDADARREYMATYMRERRAGKKPAAAAPAAKAPSARGNGEHKEPGPKAGTAVWDAYVPAYRIRWGVEPARNAKANSMCKQFAAAMPIEESADVIRFYLQSSRELYVRAKHDLALAVRDAQALRTEWLRGRHDTDTAARQGDRTAARGAAFQRILEDDSNGKD